MGERVRVGMIGTSWYADLLHLPSLTSDARAEVVAICGRNRERAAEMAEKYGIPTVYTDYRAMIDSGQLDAVVIATPDDQHLPMTMAALDAGLHVVCEKPLALNAKDARTMAEKAEAAGVKNMTFFTFRWFPHARFLHSLIQDGFIGQPYHVQISYVHGGGRDGARYAWRLDGRRANGVLGDLGTHMLDLARWFNGEITAVCAQLSNFVARVDASGGPVTLANDAALVQLRFANGAHGLVHVSAVAHLGDRGLEQQIALHGKEGTLEAEFAFRNSDGAGEAVVVRGIRSGETEFQSLEIPATIRGDVDPGQPLEVFWKQNAGDRAFIDAILSGQEVRPNFRDGLYVQQLIDAALESDRRGCWVEMGEIGERDGTIAGQ